MIEATTAQAITTGKESIRVKMARKKAAEYLESKGIKPRIWGGNKDERV